MSSRNCCQHCFGAPQSFRPSRSSSLYERRSQKEKHFELLDACLDETPTGPLRAVLGDANVRWHGRLPGEEQVLRPHLFGHCVDFLNSRVRSSRLNRNLAWDLLAKHNLRHTSSFASKHMSKKASYREPGNSSDASTSYESHAELDQLWASPAVFRNTQALKIRKDFRFVTPNID